MSFESVLDELNVSADPFALCELQGRCSLGLPGQPGVTVHYILAGEGEIVFKDRKPIPINRGTLVLAPTIVPHSLRSFGGLETPIPECHPAELDLASHLSGAPDEDQGKLLAICSHLSIGLRGSTGLIEMIRDPIVARIEEGKDMSGIIQRLLRELSTPRLGSRAIIRTLLLECVLMLIRERMEAEENAFHWMSGLSDQRLWSALKTMLDSPGESHSVQSLAGIAGMSRSSFAAHFAEAYGTGPMDLLRDIRVHLAGTMLAESKLPIKRIAELVGFRSRSAFSRVFKEISGSSPDEFRKSQSTD